MDKKQLSLGVVLSLVALALASVLYWGPEPSSVEKGTAEIWRLDSEDIVSIELERDDGSLILNHDEHWSISEPKGWYPDPWRARDLANDISQIKRGISISGNPKHYGLHESVVNITVKEESGKSTSFTVGKNTASDERTYIRLETGEMFAVAPPLSESVRTPWDSFRDHRVIRFDVRYVDRFELQAAAGLVSISRSEGAYWMEGFSRVAPNKFEDILLDLADLRVERFVNEVEGTPWATIRIDVRGETKLIEFFRNEGDTATVKTADFIGEFPISAAKFLSAGPTDFGYAEAFPVEEARSIRVDARGKTGQALMVEKGWDEVEKRRRQVFMIYRRTAPHLTGEPIAELTFELANGTQKYAVHVGPDTDTLVAVDLGGGEPYLTSRIPVQEFINTVLEPSDDSP